MSKKLSNEGLREVWDRYAPRYDRDIGFFERIQFSGGREWVAMPTADAENSLKPGTWNYLEVFVHGNHIITHVNGTKVADFNDSTPRFTDGVIALQIHTGGGVKVRWKDIYIKAE